MKQFKSIKIPIFYKIMFSFFSLIIVIMIVFIVGGIVTQRNAQTYIADRLNERYINLIEEAELAMVENEWEVTDDGFMDYLQNYSVRRDLRIELLNSDGDVLFIDNRAGGLPPEMPKPKEDSQWLSFFAPEIVDEKMPVTYNGDTVAYVYVRYFDPKHMNQEDLNLFNLLNSIFIYMLITLSLVTLIISFILARGITKPLRKVSDTAKKMSDGQLDCRAEVDSRTSEILELSESINALAISLEQEDVLRKQVTSDMAHEIRTPLTSLRNFFEAFLDGVYEIDEENLTKCHHEILRMTDLVDRLKDLSMIEALNLVSQKEYVHLSQHINGICDMMAPEFDRKNLKLQLNLDNKIRLNIDPNQLTQIMTNLLSNACRYTNEGGDLVIDLRKSNGVIELSLKDTGIGIPKEDMPYIFERFYRSEKSRDRATGGMGVGLTIVKKLVEMNSGQVEIESEVGQGTTVTLSF